MIDDGIGFDDADVSNAIDDDDVRIEVISGNDVMLFVRMSDEANVVIESKVDNEFVDVESECVMLGVLAAEERGLTGSVGNEKDGLKEKGIVDVMIDGEAAVRGDARLKVDVDSTGIIVMERELTGAAMLDAEDVIMLLVLK